MQAPQDDHATAPSRPMVVMTSSVMNKYLMSVAASKLPKAHSVRPRSTLCRALLRLDMAATFTSFGAEVKSVSEVVRCQGIQVKYWMIILLLIGETDMNSTTNCFVLLNLKSFLVHHTGTSSFPDTASSKSSRGGPSELQQVRAALRGVAQATTGK